MKIEIFLSKNKFCIYLVLFIQSLILLESHNKIQIDILFDQGYLWYGVQRVISGEVPIRDFSSYDLGRYYLIANAINFIGINNYFTFRLALGLVQLFGISTALILISRKLDLFKKEDILYLIVTTVTITTWMFIPNRAFEASIPIIQILVFTHLIDKKTINSYFIGGLCIGISAVFGRNFGVYSLFAGLIIVGYIGAYKNFIYKLSIFFIGIIIGFSPIIFFSILNIDFLNAFILSVKKIFEFGQTNISQQVPWPWLVFSIKMPIVASIRYLIIGILFVGLLIFPLIIGTVIIIKKIQCKNLDPLIVTTGIFSIPYAHFAFSRADLDHLADGIFPLLIGVIILISMLSNYKKILAIFFLCIISIFITYDRHPAFYCFSGCKEINIGNNNFITNDITFKILNKINSILEKNPQDSHDFYAIQLPGLYSIFESQSPTYETYQLLPVRPELEDLEIVKLKKYKPHVLFYLNNVVDNPDFSFNTTHPRIFRYLNNNFYLIDSSLPFITIYRNK